MESHPYLIVLCWFDPADRTALTAIPPHDPMQRVHGVFATRSPNRPKPSGFCVVDLIRREGRVLRVRRLDVLMEHRYLTSSHIPVGSIVFPKARQVKRKRRDVRMSHKLHEGEGKSAAFHACTDTSLWSLKQN
ncbi:MAG: TrmO family methyltransferase [Methanoregula sp.]|nr:TrmO family methyltransferase [Methanoregula sp.]